MDLERMLHMCQRDQWNVTDLDWSVKPRAMSREEEMHVVQWFTDMAGIERLAGAMFVEQERRVSDPKLKAIFASFVGDEVRHSHVAQMLADHYDVHKYKVYRASPSLERFFPHFVDAVRFLSDDVANLYITCGELILDIALLRSIDDYVGDEMSARAMELVNRDESRHIAIDYHMGEHYGSPSYRSEREKRPRQSMTERIAALRAFGALILFGRPFFRDVFFGPMDTIDPTGRRLREAFRRIQLFGAKPGIMELPFPRFLHALQGLFLDPRVGPRTQSVLARIAGMEPRFMEQIATEEELARAARMSMDELAEEALQAKDA